MGGDELLAALPRAAPAPDLTTVDNGVTFVIVSAGGPIATILPRIRIELDTGRRVHVVATPRAASWLGHYGVVETIETMTGWPLRSEMPLPTMPTFDPPGSSVLVSPCTLNTLTKWAAGHGDNLAISLLNEAIGRGVPTRAEVSLSGPYAAHPAALDALGRLADLGVELCRAHGTTEPTDLPPVADEVAAALDPIVGPRGGPRSA